MNVFICYVCPNFTMKKILILFIAVFCINTVSKAAPGDTTWVQANNVYLTYYNNYDTAVAFPAAGTSYRKILMIFTLGKYVCPGYTYGTGSVPWCGDWDYTIQNFLMTPGGDTLELGRLITPYANAGAPRTPYTWTQHYVYDVTDYAPLLHDAASMRILFSGYSGGFTGNIRFAFIEGTPDRTVKGITKLWSGSPHYGDTTGGGINNINNFFTLATETAPAGTNSTEMKFTVTGHGSDANYCCEFMSHNYQVLLNGSTINNKAIWRSNCGSNELYPQSGTWLYERANWCPGAMVYSDHIVLPGITAGSTFNTNITFDPYAVGGSYGVYTSFGTIFYYGPLNKATDASLDYIVAPTNDENFFRENPVVEKPTVRVKNTGSNTITSITFSYGLQDSAMSTYTWTGSLASLTDTDIVLPVLPQLGAVAGLSGTYTFTATITAVNGAADEDVTNNTLSSQFLAAPYWPNTFKVQFKTNNEDDGTGHCETNWTIYDMNDVVVAQRINNALSTQYIDTISPGPGCYKLVITDGSCDGLNWWANAGTSITSGNFYIKKLSGVSINMNGYNYSGQYNNDFGCGFTQYFRTDWPLAITDVTKGTGSMEVYPNPAQNTVNVDLAGIDRANGTISVVDALGRVVTSVAAQNMHEQVNVSSLANGVYTIQYTDVAGNKIQARLVIAN